MCTIIKLIHSVKNNFDKLWSTRLHDNKAQQSTLRLCQPFKIVSQNVFGEYLQRNNGAACYWWHNTLLILVSCKLWVASFCFFCIATSLIFDNWSLLFGDIFWTFIQLSSNLITFIGQNMDYSSSNCERSETLRLCKLFLAFLLREGYTED